MNPNRALILRLRHDSPTREAALEAADMIEELSRAQRRLPHAQTVSWGYDGDDFPEPGFVLALPPFDGVEEAQMELRRCAQPRAELRMCSCVGGTCQTTVEFGRTSCGAHCRAHIVGG